MADLPVTPVPPPATPLPVPPVSPSPSPAGSAIPTVPAASPSSSAPLFKRVQGRGSTNAHIKEDAAETAAAKGEGKPKGAGFARRWLTDYYAATVLFLFAAFLLVAFGFLKPKIDGIKTLRAEAEALDAQAEQEGRYAQSLQRSVAAAQGIPPETLRLVEEALPSEADTPSLLVQFNAAAGKNDIRIVSLALTEPRAAVSGSAAVPSPAPGRSVGNVQSLDASLTLNAKNYGDLKRFLSDVESNLRVMDVTGIAVSGITPEGDITFQVQLKTYLYADPAKKVPSTQP